jgi:hypothetical protein
MLRLAILIAALIFAGCDKEPQYVPVDLGKRVPKEPAECTATPPVFPAIPEPPFAECPDPGVMCPVAQAKYLLAVQQWRRRMEGDRKICRAYVKRIVPYVNRASK